MQAANQSSERRRDQIDRREDIHRAEKHEAAEAGAGEIGEIDAPEGLVALQEDAAQEHRAAEERRQRSQEDLGELPLLVGIGDQIDRIEAELLDVEIGADRERPHQAERDARGDPPVAREPVLGDRHDGAGQAEAEHREADDQRTEMRPVADREHAHDVDLQRDHRAGGEADREIEREPPARRRARDRRRRPSDAASMPSFILELFRSWPNVSFRPLVRTPPLRPGRAWPGHP